MADEDGPVAPHDVVGGWTLRERIGQGGMGEVWRADKDGVETAVKLIFTRPDRRAAQQKRFEREVAAAARVDHPGVARVLEFGADDERGSLYLVMELLRGRTLRQRMRDGARPDQVAAWLRALLEPLAAAHSLAEPIVHRDLKPENVFLTEAGEVKLLDFGIARQSGAGTQVTETGAGLGTAAYMSPEQATEARDVGPTADVWSFGVMLYEAIAGRLPFDAPSKNEIITKILTRAPVPLAELAPRVPAGLAELVDRCLAKEPERRPRDAAALAEALDRWLPEARPALEAAPTRAEPDAPPAPPRRVGLAVAAAAALAIAGGVFALRATRSGDPRPDDPARAPRPPAAPVADPAAGGGGDASGWLDPAYARVEAAPDVRLGVDDPDLAPAFTGFRPSADRRGPRAPYLIQRREVTWGELDPWLDETGHDDARAHPPAWLPADDRARYPATGVPWAVARAYCRARGGDLPTEAQWEWAARAAARSEPADAGAPRIEPADARDEPEQSAAPGPEAVLDLLGNAREWTRERFRADADGEVAAWADADGRTYRTVRGRPVFARSRFAPPPGAPYAHRVPLCATGPCPEGTDAILQEVGFRCVRPIPAPSSGPSADGP